MSQFSGMRLVKIYRFLPESYKVNPTLALYMERDQGFSYHFPTPFTVSVGALRGGGSLDQNFLRGGIA